MSVFIEGLSADYVLDHCNRTIDPDGISDVTVHMVLNEVEVEKIRIKKISTPHGRLIDADAFLKLNKEFADRDFIHPKYEVTLRELIDDSPTIVEAEPYLNISKLKKQNKRGKIKINN